MAEFAIQVAGTLAVLVGLIPFCLSFLVPGLIVWMLGRYLGKNAR